MEKDSSNIFVKYNDIPEKERAILPDSSKLLKEDIIDSIPNMELQSRNDELSKSKTEWRWRFFKFPNKESEIVEISFTKPNEPRKYINSEGDWVERKICESFDQYVTNMYYHYK